SRRGSGGRTAPAAGISAAPWRSVTPRAPSSAGSAPAPTSRIPGMRRRSGAAQRWQFLAQASIALGSSLEADQVLRTIARLSVPAFADWCSVDMIEADESVRRVAVTHADPTLRDIADMAATYPPDPDARHPRTTVLRTGRPVLFREVPDEGLAQIAADEKHLAALRRLAYGSVIIVAIAARGRILGALTFATTAESGRRYGPDDL